MGDNSKSDAGKRRRGRRALKIAAVVIVVIALLVAAVGVGLIHRPEWVLPWAQKAAAGVGRPFDLQTLDVRLDPLTVEARGLTARGPGYDLEADRVLIRPRPAGLWGSGPYLDRAEVLDFDLEMTASGSNGGQADLTSLKTLFHARSVRLENGRIAAKKHDHVLVLSSFDLRLSPEAPSRKSLRLKGKLQATGPSGDLSAHLDASGRMNDAPEISLNLDITDGRVDAPRVVGAWSGRVEAKIDPASVSWSTVTFDAPDLKVQVPDREAPLTLDAAVALSGRHDLDGSDPSLNLQRLAFGDWFDAQGQFSGPDLTRLSGELKGRADDAARLKGVLSAFWPAEPLAELTVSGGAAFRVQAADLTPRPELTLTVEPVDLEASYGVWRVQPGGRVTLTASGAEPIRLGGELSVSGSHRGRPGVERFQLDGTLSGTLNQPAVEGLSLSAPAGSVSLDGRPLPLSEVKLTGDLGWEKGGIQLESGRLSIGNLGEIKGDLSRSEGRWAGRWTGRLSARPLPELLGALGVPGAAFSAQGGLHVAFEVIPAEDRSDLSLTVDLAEIGFSSTDGSIMAQKLNGRIDVRGSGLDFQPARVDVRLEGGQALYQTVLVDYAKQPVSASISGLRRRGAGLAGRNFQIDWADLGALSGQGRLTFSDGPAFRGELDFQSSRIDALFATFVRDPLSAARPALAELKPSGRVGLSLAVSGPTGRPRWDGRLSLADLTVADDAGAMIEGLRLDLPLAYHWAGEAPSKSGPPAQWGRLTADSVKFGFIGMKNVQRAVALVPNRLMVRGDIDLPLYGGRLTLSGLSVADPLSAGFKARAEAKLVDLDFERLSSSGVQIKGRLGGGPWPVEMNRERLTVDGDLRGRLYGGRLDMERVFVDQPLSPGRTFGANVRIDALNLEPFSLALGIGRITGKVDLRADRFRFAYGLPVRFDLTVLSVPEPEVQRRISIKAVNSISILGTGRGAGEQGVSLVGTFLDNLPYREIGLACHLRQNIFTLRGLIEEDGVEYIVKRGPLMGVDVVNRSPENQVAFKEMIQRIKRAVSSKEESS